MAASGRHNADDLLLMALARGVTVEKASKEADVSSRTTHRRLADPLFRQRLNQLRAEMVRRAAAQITAAAGRAIEALVGLLQNSTPSIRLGAARAILEVGGKLREAADLEARLVALEKQLATPQSFQNRS